MTADELDAAAAAVLEDAITTGRLPAAPSPEVLARIADVVRPSLAMKKTATAIPAAAVSQVEARTSGAPAA